MKKVLMLSYNDFKNILREPTLTVIAIGPILFTIMIRFIVPYITKLLAPYFDLLPYYSLLASYVLLFIPLLMGMVSGFILLDEKDDNTWMCLITTPLGKKGYLLYRILFPAIISFIYALAVIPFINIVEFQLLYMIPIALLGALEAPIVSLYLSLFASNKVEGLVLSKSLGIFMVAPLIQYFTKSKLAILAGIIPAYWPVQSFLSISNTIDYTFNIAVGLIVHIGVLLILVIKFDKKIQ